MKTKSMGALLIVLMVLAALIGACKQEAEVEMGSRVFGSPSLFKGYMTVDGQQDIDQLTVQGYSTQTNDLLVLEISDGTDKFVVDASGNVVAAGTIASTGDSTFTLGAADKVLVDGASTAQTQTAGALDINAASVTTNTAGLDVLMTANDGTVAATPIYGARFTITNNDADADMFGLKVVASATANATTSSYEYGYLFDCAENTAATCLDGLLVTSTGANLGVTDGVDVSAANILYAVNIGVNPILGSNDDFFTVGVTDDAFIFARNDSGSATYSCVDDDANADCIYDSGGTGTVTLGSADTTNVTVNSDVGLTFAGGADSINNLVDDVFDFTRDDTGIVTFTCSDDDATAGCTYDAGGVSPIVIGSADVTTITVNSDSGLTFANNADSINNLVDAFFDFGRDDTGIVTLVCSDDDAVAGCTYDAGGASPIIIGSADVTAVSINSDTGLTFVDNADSINNLVDDFFDFGRDDAGIVTLTCSDDDAVAGCTYDAGGASPIVVGSADVTAITLTTAGNVLTMADAPAAGAGGDFLNLAGTFDIADGSDAMVGLDLNLTGANHTGTGNSTIGIDLGLTTPDPQASEKGLLINDADWDYGIDVGPLPILSSAQTWMEDFFGADVLTPTYMVFLAGTDTIAHDPSVAQAQYGTIELQSGNSGTNVATDASELALGLHWMADQGSLVFETRLYVDDITTVHICVGMGDTIALEMPMDLTTDTPAQVADDFVGFCFDTDATTDRWWFVGVDETTESTGNAVTSVAPVNGAYQVFRVEIDAGGEDARGYINGALVGTLTANVIDIDVGLSPIVIVNALVGIRTMTVDYIYVSAQRQ